MPVSGQDVLHIAALARLEIAPERVDTLVAELNGILAHMDVLQGLDMSATAAMLPDASADPDAADPDAAAPTTLRADVPGAVALQRERSAFAPAARDGFFLVPRLSTHE